MTTSTTTVELGDTFGIGSAELSDMVSRRDRERLEGLGGVAGVASRLQTDLATGLSEVEEARGFADRRAVFGDNRLPQAPSTGFLSLWLDALKDTTLIILMVAAVVSIIIGAAVPSGIGEVKDCTAPPGREADEGAKERRMEWIEGVAILGAVAIVSLVTAGNNYTKELKFRALSAKEQDFQVTVLRCGRVQSVSVLDVNVGDLVFLGTGDQVPADGILTRGDNLRVDESQMTGEAEEVKKTARQDPFLLSGCKVTDGSGQMLATAVGSGSEWGKTMSSLSGDKPRPTPLQTSLDHMAASIGKVGTCVAALVFAVLVLWWLIPAATSGKELMCRGPGSSDFDPCIDPGTLTPEEQRLRCELRGYDWGRSVVVVQYFIMAVTIVVVAVPEGLPLAVTISLAYSMKQMYKDQNLVRHLKSCETMSNCTVICTDKTGTITENRMTVVRAWIAGRVSEGQPAMAPVGSRAVELISEGIAMNTAPTSSVFQDPAKGGALTVVGNKTEGALLMMLEVDLGVDHRSVRGRLSEDVFQRFPFNSTLKKMSTAVWAGDRSSGMLRLHVKGAPEILLRQCRYQVGEDGRVVPLDDPARDALLDLVSEWASRGLRTLCLGFKELPAPAMSTPGAVVDPDDESVKFEESPDDELAVLAVVGIQDPLRSEVPTAVADCQAAGISVRMITGDNLATAKSIARSCHILGEEGQVCLEGPEFARLTDAQLDELLPHLQVVARCLPDDKRRLVRRLVDKGEVVAVTGDGVNDVRALKEADVGLAMGMRGTEMAKQASDIVIMDDNFQSIVRSVLWGRNVYDNIRKFLQFQLTVNVVALAVVLVGALTKRGAPLKAIQLLWVNLIMDTFAALALGTEKPTRDLLQRRPFGRFDRLLSNFMLRAISVQAVLQTAVLLCLLYFGARAPWLGVPCAYRQKNFKVADPVCGNERIDEETVALQTCVFNTFVYFQVFNLINSRKVNGERNVYSGVFSNWMFVGILLLIALGQAVLVIFFGDFMSVVPFPGINWAQWLTCLGLALTALPAGLPATFIPVPKYTPRKFNGGNKRRGPCCGLLGRRRGTEDETQELA